MPTIVRYRDRTLTIFSLALLAGSLAGFVSAAFGGAPLFESRSLFGVVYSLFYALFLGSVGYVRYRAAAVEVEVGPTGIIARQSSLGWRIAWPSVTQLVVVPLKHPRLVVVSPRLPSRWLLSEWPLRKSGLPPTKRSLPATPEILNAVSYYCRRPIQQLPPVGH